MSEDIQGMLDQARELIDIGRLNDARAILQKITDQDPEDAEAWLLTAQAVDDPNEKRICLDNVLHIDPGNEEAQQMLADMGKTSRKSAKSKDFAPGIPRRQMNLIVIACIAFAVVSCGISFMAANSINTAKANTAATQVAQLQNLTQAVIDQQATETAIKVEETQVAFNATATAIATITPTLTPTRTPDLPPTFTPTPTITLTPTPSALEAPPALGGTIIAWGRQDLFNNNFRELFLFPMNSGGHVRNFSPLNQDTIRFPTIHPSGQRMIYMKYQSNINTWVLTAINADGSQEEDMTMRFQGQAQIIEPEMPSYSPDGTQLAFVATSVDNGTKEAFVFNLTSNVLLRLTEDTANYSFPVISADGQKVMVVRDDPATGGIDLSSIALNDPNFAQTPITTNGNQIVESSPSWAPDGRSIIYAAHDAANPNDNNVYLSFSDGRGTPIEVVATDADEILPKYSGDGLFVVYAANPLTNYNIFIFELSTGKTWQLTISDEDIFPGGWSRN